MPQDNERDAGNKALTVDDFAKQKPRSLPLHSIIADETTQTRLVMMGTKREQEEAYRKSRQVVAAISKAAKADDKYQLSHPIFVAEVEGRYRLVDGHHRVQGLKGAGNHGKVRAYVLKTDRQTCDRLALQANAKTQTIPEALSERTEKAWMYTKAAHDGKQWITGESAAAVSVTNGVGMSTIKKMIKYRKRLPTIMPDGWEGLDWVGARQKIEEWDEVCYDEKEDRDAALQGAKVALKLSADGKIHTETEVEWLYKTLMALVTDGNVPYGLTAEELVSYCKAKEQGEDARLDSSILEETYGF